MKKMTQSKKIIIFFSLIFLLGSIYLFSIDSRYNDPEYNQDWYSLSFIDPKSDSLDFSIENFSAKTDFHWEILEGKKSVSQGDENIQTGEKQDIHIADLEKKNDQKYTIRVTSDTAAQEIYKHY